MQQSTSIPTAWRKTPTRPLHLYRQTMDTSANSTWDQCWWFRFTWCVSTFKSVGDDKASVWVIDPDVLSDIQILLNILGPHGQRHSVHFIWSAPSWSRTPRETRSPHYSEKTQSSFDVVVFNRCLPSPWVRLLLSRSWRMMFEMVHFDTLVILDISLWESRWPENWTIFSISTGRILVGRIATFVWP